VTLAAQFAGVERVEPRAFVAPFTHAFGRAPEGELAAWLLLAERYDVARRGLLEPAVPTFEELVARVTDDRLTVYELEAFLCGGVPIFVNDDPSVDYVSLWTYADGTNPVFYVGDAEAGTYACNTSLAAHVAHVLAAPRDRRRAPALDEELALPPHLDPKRLYERARWVIRVAHGVSSGSDRDDTAGAGTRDEWERELPLVRSWPHLAAHWLLQHRWFDHEAELAEILSATRDMTHPIVRRLHQPSERARNWRGRLVAVDPWKR
jgi:hypothetical protein